MKQQSAVGIEKENQSFIYHITRSFLAHYGQFGTYPRSKIKSRKSRNIEVRRVLITYMFHFFLSDQYIYMQQWHCAVNLLSSSSHQTIFIFLKKKLFCVKQKSFVHPALDYSFFFWLSFSTSVTLYMNISCNLLYKKLLNR